MLVLIFAVYCRHVQLKRKQRTKTVTTKDAVMLNDSHLKLKKRKANSAANPRKIAHKYAI